MYAEWIERIERASNASERSRQIKEFARLHGFPLQRAYRELEEAGWDSGRKTRADSGNRTVDDGTIKMLAAMIRTGIRKNGKKTMPVNVARSILQENGYDIPVSDSCVRRALREALLDAESVKVASPFQRMRTEYPNQVHQCDPSVSLLYFTPGGKQHLLRDDEVYKNKPFLEGRENLKCWRYVLTDHYSSSICVRYYATAGESAAVLYDFLLYAWGQKADPLYAFHGLPDLLVWDPGSANKSKAITNALRSLKVETNPHMPGNPRAKGQVEKMNDIVETHFESRLRLEEVHNIEELNDAAERFSAAYSANMIPGIDTRLTRMHQKVGTRLALWQTIPAEHLRELPDAEICRLLLTTGVESRKVGGDLGVGYSHPLVKRSLRYSLRDCPGLIVGQEVNVQPVLVGNGCDILVSYRLNEEMVSYEIEPIEVDEAGFDLSAPIFGKEFKSLPDTKVEKNVADLVALAAEGAETINAEGEVSKAAVPFSWANDGKGLAAHSFIKPHADIVPARKVGEQVSIGMPDVVAAHDILISAIESAKRIKARLGYVPEGFVETMRKEYPDGVPASRIDDIAREYETGDGFAALSM